MRFLCSILGSAILITKASLTEDPWAIVGVSIYGFTLMLLSDFAQLVSY